MQKWLKAKLKSPCAICEQTIQIGDRILPFGAQDEHSFRYCHLSCAKERNSHTQEGAETPVCKHWRSRGYCLFGDKCVFQHPPELAAAVERAATLRAAHAPTSNAAMRAGGPVRRKGQRPKVRNRFRAGAFRRWLLDTFDRETLQEGAGVLDVAGGKGELAFELANLNGILATVVEPRELHLEKATLRLESGYYHWNTAFSAAYNDRCWISTSLGDGAAGGSAAERSAAPVLNHLRLVITPELCCQLGLPTWDAVAASGEGEEGAAVEEGGEGAAVKSEGVAHQGAAAAAPMPAGWPAALRRAQLQAQHSRWTRKGLEHESATSAAAAAGGGAGESSSDSEDPARDIPAGAAAGTARAVSMAGSGRSSGGSRGTQEDAAVLVAQPTGDVGAAGQGTDSSCSSNPESWPSAAPALAGGAGAAAAAAAVAAAAAEGDAVAGGNCSQPAAQLANVGAFLEGLFAEMNSAGHEAEANQPQSEAAQSRQQGVQQGPPQAALAGQPAACPTSEGCEEVEMAGLSAAQVANVGTFLEGLFSQVDSAAVAVEVMQAGGQQRPELHPQLPGRQQQQQQPQCPLPPPGQQQPQCPLPPPGQQQPLGKEGQGEEGQEGGEEEEEQGLLCGQTPEQLARVGAFLDGLFAEMDLAEPGLAATKLQSPQPPGQQMQPETEAQAGAAASNGSAVEQGTAQGAGEAPGESVECFLGSLFASIEAGEQGGLPPPAATPTAGMLARSSSPAGTAGSQGAEAAPAASISPTPTAESRHNAESGNEAEAPSFLSQLFSRLDEHAWSGGRVPEVQPAPAATATPAAADPVARRCVAPPPGARLLAAREGAVTHVEVTDPVPAWQLLTGFSVAVGMHPDQATEFIVDLALKHNRPFAVVPCCVYAAEFPRRKLRGRPVTSYHQFIDYLVAKAPDRIKVAELPFQGKNKVVWGKPPN